MVRIGQKVLLFALTRAHVAILSVAKDDGEDDTTCEWSLLIKECRYDEGSTMVD